MPIEYLEGRILYENPRPHVRSRHGYFPGLALLPSGELLALFVIAEAFESADATTWTARSCDLGRSWDLEGAVIAAENRRGANGTAASDYLKPTALRNGTLASIGYRFYRADPEQGISIEAIGGILPGDDIITFSPDGGRSWTEPAVIPRSCPELLEISGPCLELRSGDLIATAAPLPMPDGANPSGQLGFVLRSSDKGKTWTSDQIYFRSPAGNMTPFESRVCEMQDGRLVAIVWACDTAAGRHHANHLAVSHDDGRTWSPPLDTGCWGQASHLVWLGGDSLLTVHAHRGEDPRISVRVVDFRRDHWHPVEEMTIYGSGSRPQTSEGQDMPQMFAALRFGQPSLLKLTEDEFLAVHWAVEDGQGKIRTHRLRVGVSAP